MNRWTYAVAAAAFALGSLTTAAGGFALWATGKIAWVSQVEFRTANWTGPQFNCRFTAFVTLPTTTIVMYGKSTPRNNEALLRREGGYIKITRTDRGVTYNEMPIHWNNLAELRNTTGFKPTINDDPATVCPNEADYIHLDRSIRY